MIRKFISQVDGAEFQYRFNGINLELKADGCDWSDFIKSNPNFRGDSIAKRCAFNDYVDSLNKDGLVTDYQAYNWSNPF